MLDFVYDFTYYTYKIHKSQIRRLSLHAIINPAELKFSAWNTNSVSPGDQEKLEESLRRNGQFRPVIVRELHDGSLEVIGGEHTTRAILNLGWDKISTYSVGRVSEKKAKEISILDNGRYGTDDALELSELLAELGTAAELAAFMPMAESDISSIFSNKDIDLDDLDFDDEDTSHAENEITSTPKTHQIMRFKVPIDDAEFVESVIKTTIDHHGLKSTDSLEAAGNALVHILNKGR